jgi:AcrR family transcriptional regulator
MSRLLAAGGRVFAERGYHAARVDDIVKAARTSHGTFYLYFSSKEDLFRAIAEGVAAEMVDLARELPSLEAGAAHGDTSESFRAWLGRFSTLYADHGDFLRTWTDAEVGNGDLGRVARDLVLGFSEELAERVRVAAPDLDARMAAFALVSMIERTSYYTQTRHLDVSVDETLDVLAHVTRAALGTSDPPSP